MPMTLTNARDIAGDKAIRAYDSGDIMRGDYYCRLWLVLLHVVNYVDADGEVGSDEGLMRDLICAVHADTMNLRIALDG